MLGYFLSYNSHTISNVVTILRAGLHPFLQMAIPSHRKGVAIRSKRCSLVKCVLRMLLAGIIAACIESVFLCPRLVFILLHPKKKRKRKNLRWQITLPRQYNISYPTIKIHARRPMLRAWCFVWHSPNRPGIIGWFLCNKKTVRRLRPLWVWMPKGRESVIPNRP